MISFKRAENDWFHISLYNQLIFIWYTRLEHLPDFSSMRADFSVAFAFAKAVKASASNHIVWPLLLQIGLMMSELFQCCYSIVYPGQIKADNIKNTPSTIHLVWLALLGKVGDRTGVCSRWQIAVSLVFKNFYPESERSSPPKASRFPAGQRPGIWLCCGKSQLMYFIPVMGCQTCF